jgi:uncharacterized membrane protein
VKRLALSGIRERIRNLAYGFAFLPTAVAAGVLALAIALVHLDHRGGAHGVGGFGGDAGTARTVMQTIATALITVAGVTFSITVVTLQLVSQQFSPRSLRTFLADRLNQVVAGSFVGIFAYCLLVLRAVRSAGKGERLFVPGLSVTVGIGLALVTLVLLLAFIHHMSTSIQLSSIAARIGQGTLRSVETLYPERFGSPDAGGGPELIERWRRQAEPLRLCPGRPGYVQSIALDDLPREEGAGPACVHITVAPGAFVSHTDPIAEIWGDRRHRLEQTLRAAIVVENERELAQDTAYGVRQLSDITIKALSPGVNDPTTACTSIGYAGAILDELSGRAFPSAVRRYPDGSTVVFAQRSFADYVDIAIAEPGRYATGHVRVVCALLDIAVSAARRAASAGAHDRVETLSRAAYLLAGLAVKEADEAGRAALDGRLARLPHNREDR